MKIALNAVSAKMGGAATYIKNLARELASLKLEDEFIFFVPEEQAQAIRGLAPNIRVMATEIGSASFLKRLWFDQVVLRRWLKREKVDALYSTANFGMVACPCHQVLLVRNAIYFSEIYWTRIMSHKSLLAKLEDKLRLWLVLQSTKWADVVMTPSQDMMDVLQRFTKIRDDKAKVNHYGVTIETASALQCSKKLANPKEKEWRFLYSAIYTEYKNLTTVLRSLLLLVEEGWRFRFITSADPWADKLPMTQIKQLDIQLLNDLRLKDCIEFTGKMTSEQIAEFYRQVDLFLYPSVIESFGHPLVEAMANGVPVIASNIAINQELCADAALYFDKFDAQDCAEKIRQVLEDDELRCSLASKGRQQARRFTWDQHIQNVLAALCQ